MIDLLFWAPVMLGGTLAGASNGIVGVFVVGMRLPFLGVCVSHAALAGAVFAALCGLSGQWLLLPALGAALLVALLLGHLDPNRLRVDSQAMLAVLFTLSMGLAFLGIGLFSVFGRSDNEIRNLLWGSVALARWSDLRWMAAATGLVLAYVTVFAKELRAILFCRVQAQAAGIHVSLIWSGFLALTSAVLTVSFQSVGGLMIYSLMTCPAIAAFQLTRGYAATLRASALIGGFCGISGFLLAAWIDLPTGATTVLLASLCVVMSLAAGWHLRRRPPSAGTGPSS